MVGDTLLREVSQSLRQVTNRDQKVFRTGGDEFIFIMKNCDRAKLEIIAGLILEQISRPYTIEGNHLNITGSIGISMSRARYVERDKMIEQADTAMYCAKRMGKNRYSIYRESRHRYLKAIELTLAQR